MNKLVRKKAELSLLYAIPILCNARENSKLAGLQRKLQETTIPLLNNIIGFTDVELNQTIDKLLIWGKDTGWLNNQKHIGSIVSFCILMLENSEFTYPQKLYDILNKIVNHIEQNNQLYITSCVSGTIAFEKWEKLFK